MTLKIFTGFDCRKDYKYPKRKLRIYPRNITMNIGESVDLNLLTTHPLCDPACYAWKILHGGGHLIGDFGIENIYYAPSDNDLCEANPTIAVFTTGYPIDKISIGVTGLSKPVPAVLEAKKWEQPEFELAKFYRHLVGMKYCDKDPRVHYWTIRIDEYGCDGSRTNQFKVGIVNELVEAGCGIRINKNRFVLLSSVNETWHRFWWVHTGTFEDAQTEVLRAWLQDYVFRVPTILHRKFGIEGARWRYGKPRGLGPSDTIDVRMDKVIDLECCPHLIAALQYQET